MRRRLPLILFALSAEHLAAQNSAETIDTPRGPCGVWAMPMGGSTFPRDASYSRCALDRAPSPRSESITPPIPMFEGHIGGWIRVVINADGTVHPTLTRMATESGDPDDVDALLTHVKSWRFEAGARAGANVRSAIDLEVRTDRRASDTLPARLEWRYVAGWDRDSLLGRWVTETPPSSLDDQQLDSVHVALLRRLVMNNVITVAPTRHYCLASADSGKTSVARLARIARAVRRDIPQLATTNCVDTRERVRVELPRVQLTEQGRVVMRLAGAQLPRWPTGFDTRAWDRWTGRCVGTVRGRESVALRCDVVPVAPYAETSQWNGRRREQPPARAQRSEKLDDTDRVQLAVLVTMTGAYGIDTIRSVVNRVPRLQDVARVDTVDALTSWVVWSPTNHDSSAMVVHGALGFGRLQLTAPALSKWAPDSSRTPSTAAATQRREPVVALFLDGVGTRPVEPLMLCYSSCDRRYELNPSRHSLPPVARFRVASLRDVTRSARGHLELRVQLNPLPEGAMPIVVFNTRDGKTLTASFMRDLGGGVWDAALEYQDFDYTTLDGLVYLIRR